MSDKTKSELIRDLCEWSGTQYKEGQKHLRKNQLERIQSMTERDEVSPMKTYTVGFLLGSFWGLIVLVLWML